MCCTDFAAMLLDFFFRRRSREINGGVANDDAAANDEIARGASSTHILTESQEMQTSSGYDYEVFLSFRGLNTRAGFTDVLYTSLKRVGIRTFRDDEELRVGEEFAPELLEAIEQSKISIPIFSKDYASSAWCLKELVRMVECRKNGKQKIMPIFYNVAPSEVRRQTGDYEKAFREHEKKKRYGEETISQWKDALRVVGDLSGWDLHREGENRQEGLSAETITQKIFKELKTAYLEESDYLVSVDDQVDKIKKMIDAQASETRIIGIYGMGGIGKTTIAKIIYNQLLQDFENCCFLPNIQETSKGGGISYLQHRLISDILNTKEIDIRHIDEGITTIKKRLSHKKVLILLDDMEERVHVNALVGNHDWFGKGSKIIITTRNKEILKLSKVNNLHEVHGMDRDQSLQLFSKHAFRRDSPLHNYINESDKAIGIAGGLPLAIEVIASYLSHVEKEEWDDKLKMLENVPHKDVQSKLRISYDALSFRDQRIFLDIACLFIGYDKDILVHFWNEYRFYPKEAMNVLENRSLIKIEKYNKVWMHDQLRDLGREIVQEESNMKMEKQSRVWDPEQGLEVMRTPKVKKEIEALRVKLDRRQFCFTYKGFENLSDLRFLELEGSYYDFQVEERLLWHESSSNLIPTNENSDLLSQLRWLSWHRIPPTLNISNFSMENVVILDLSYSSTITDDWKGWSHMKVMKNLKILNLSRCYGLERTPNFSALSKLERLILFNCRSLIEIDRSICQLEHLISLNASACWELQRMPEVLGGQLVKLEYLYLNGCQSLGRLPDSIGNLQSLIELDISDMRIRELPNSIINLKNLKVVKMSHNLISKIPEALWTIEKLEEIECQCLLSHKIHVKIHDGIYMNQSLRILKLRFAEIDAVPMLPKSLIELELSYLKMDMDMFPDLSNLTNLKVLDLRFGPVKTSHGIFNGLVEVFMPRWIGNLGNLESLHLGSPDVTTSPTDLTFPPCLKSLHLFCPKLRRLPRLPSSLSFLHLDHCDSLCSTEDLLNLKKLSHLKLFGAAITETQGLGCLENLRVLELSGLGQVKILSDLTNLNKLRSLRVGLCDNLVEIQGELPQSLEKLEISCKNLQKLPNLSSLNGLREVIIYRCQKLNVEAISKLCSEKSIVFRQTRI